MRDDVTVRCWCSEDAGMLAQLANNPRIAACLTDAFPHPYRMEDAIRYLNMAMTAGPGLLRAVLCEGALCGAVGLMLQTDIHRRSAECGYWLAEAFWGRGIMPEAVRQIVDLGFETLDVVRIYARPFSFNRASQRVLEKAGFTREATLRQACFKDGRFCDEEVYALLKDEGLTRKRNHPSPCRE